MKVQAVTTIIQDTVERHGLLPAAKQHGQHSKPEGVPVVLMVSGGSDSVALARLLPQVYPEHHYTLLHINHQLRGEDASEDERFVLELARTLGLPCEVRHVDVAALAAQTGDNLEQVGRVARYEAAAKLLDTLCAQHSDSFEGSSQSGCRQACGLIATAHTRDDRVETFFMRAIVGAGAGALASIPFRNGRIIRPLLDCTREQLREWLREQPCRGDAGSQPLWREDPTNEDTHYLRAFVRHELIPLAATRNPQLIPTVARSLDILSAEDALLTEQASILASNYIKEAEPGSIRVDARLLDEHPALASRVLKRVCDRVIPPGERITNGHIDIILREGHHIGFVTDIPGGVSVVNEYGTLVFRGWKDASGAMSLSVAMPLEEGGERQLPDGRSLLVVRVDPACYGDDPVAYACSRATATQVFIDGDALDAAGGILKVRSYRQGDKFCPLGMDGRHRLVSDLLIDRKVPRRNREAVWLVCAGDDRDDAEGDLVADSPTTGGDAIVWITGVQLDDRFKVSPQTSVILSIIVTEVEKA